MKKRIILITCMVISLIMIGITFYYAKENITNSATSISENQNNNLPSRETNDDTSSTNLPNGEAPSDITEGEIPSGEPPSDITEGEVPSSDTSSDITEEDSPSGEAPSNISGESLPSDSESNNTDTEKADGGFAGAGDDTTSSTITLTTQYIIFIAIWTLVFTSCLLYLIMSKNATKKAFKNNDKVILYILEDILLTGILTTIIVMVGNNYYLNSSNSSTVEYSSTDDLHIDMTNFSYDSTNNVYYQIGLVYVSNPETVEYESLGIYIPGEYLDCTKNTNDKYTCEVNEESEVNGYTSQTAPIVMPVNTAGYSAQSSPTSYSYSGLGDYLEAGFIYVYAGCRGRDNGDDYSGGAPWGVTDLKAAVRYLRYNSDSLPGDTESIFAFGHSGGGAQASILGSSGDSELYTDYLNSIGALMNDDDGNSISDAIAGVMAWCPITSLDYANEAYEWNMGQYSTTGTRSSSSWTSALSLDLAEAYAEYINALNLIDENGNILTLSNTTDGVYTSGTYYEYLLSVIENSLNNYLQDNYTNTSDMQSYIDNLNTGTEWINFNTNTQTVSITSIEDFVTHCKSASKDVGSFDDLERNQAENKVFGNDENNALHFDTTMANLLKDNASKYSKYSDYEDYSEEYLNDLEEVDKLGNSIEYRINMYNPMYYLSNYYDGYETSTVATYWRIRTGITQGDTALTVETNLALALNSYITVSSVDFETVWNQGHTTAERTGDSTENFINWINECVKN